MKWDLAAQFLNHFYNFFTTFGVNLATLASLLQDFGHIFRVKKQTGAPKVPQEAQPPKFPTPFGHFLEAIFTFFHIFYARTCVFKMCSLFSSILGRTQHSTGWAHMQSVHACAVQTHLSVFIFFFLTKILTECQLGSLWGQFCFKMRYLCENRRFRECFKKRRPAKLK